MVCFFIYVVWDSDIERKICSAQFLFNIILMLTKSTATTGNWANEISKSKVVVELPEGTSQAYTKYKIIVI